MTAAIANKPFSFFQTDLIMLFQGIFLLFKENNNQPELPNGWKSPSFQARKRLLEHHQVVITRCIIYQHLPCLLVGGKLLQ